jgi:hypothetical protein
MEWWSIGVVEWWSGGVSGVVDKVGVFSAARDES